jgi:membrane-bound hydrogenase subunit beta
MKIVKADEFVDNVSQRIGENLISHKVVVKKAGLSRREYEVVWLTIEREALIDTIKVMKNFDYPMLSVISSYDAGETVVLIYHFAIFRGVQFATLHVELEVKVPKTDLWVPTITSEIPGAYVSEQEKQEMIGIEVRGLRDMDNIFLPTDFPKDVYPWRKDETGVDAKMPKRAGGEE